MNHALCTLHSALPLTPESPMTDVLTTAEEKSKAQTSSPAPLASEQEARELAEAARETEWNPSFVKELFEGRLRLDLIRPIPAPTAGALASAIPLQEHLDPFLVGRRDRDAIVRKRAL